MNKQRLKAQALVEEAQGILDHAEAEDRDRTDAETTQVEGLLARAKRLDAAADTRDAHKAVEGQVADIGGAIGAGDDTGVQNGWAKVAEKIAGKATHFEVPGQTLLRSGASQQQVRTKDLTATDLADGAVATAPGLMGLGADRRFLYPVIQSLPVTGQLSVADYRQTGSRSVTGDVGRSLTGTTPKAELDVAVEYVQEPLRQVAVTISAIPNALLAGVPALRAFLQTEMQFQLDQAIDDHVLTEVATTEHPFDATGVGTVARLRNAIAAHRALGYDPRLAVVSPATASELDLLAFDAGYTFDVSKYGSASPLFSLQLAEHPDAVDPLLIDTRAVGVLAIGPAKFDVDSSGDEFKANVSTVRLEASVLFVLRSPQAVYEVAIAS